MRYVGDSARVGVVTPAEAQAHFARMTAAPSKAYRDAVSRAIAEWKAQGAWANIKGLWILCADTAQAAALSVIGDAPRDMTVTGAPTFTALKGYSGFDGTTKQLVFPITSAILADDDFTTVLAGILSTATTASDRMAIENATDATFSGMGNVRVSAGGVPQMASGAGFMAPVNSSGAQALVCGVRDGGYVMPSGMADPAGSALSRGSNYKTGNVAAASHPLLRLSAYGFLGSASTARPAQRFLITLATMVDAIGALD